MLFLGGADFAARTDVLILALARAAEIRLDAAVVRTILASALVLLFGRRTGGCQRGVSRVLRVRLSPDPAADGARP
jgi:uncharacterized membrane protein YdfJ with MMPL/SSD domain